jgi:L-ribulose-5-phosphate 3-epimerase
MKNPIGIIQGRLSPPVPGLLQAFPWDTWELEFERARDMGFDCLEWVFEAKEYERNPLWTKPGIKRIQELQKEYRVAIDSVCGDYFMIHPLFRGTSANLSRSISVLKRLIEQAGQIGVKTILIPVLENAAIHHRSELEQLAESVGKCLPLAQACDIRLGLEAELPGEEYGQLVNFLNSSRVCVYYDTGNNAALGHNLGQDLRFLGPVIGGVHLKDRKRGGISVMLGTGDTDFPAVFAALRGIAYRGPLILQPAFGADFMGDAHRNLDFVHACL